MRKSKLFILSLALCVVFTSSTFAADQVPNPAYQNWAQYKVGTWTRLEGSMEIPEMPGGAPKIIMTRKLVELTPEKAVVEVSMAMSMQGQEMPANTQKVDIPAKIDADKADGAMVSPDPDAKITDVKLGKETLEVMDKSLKCQTYEATVTSKGQTAQTKTWSTTEIPGGMVKMIMKMDQGTQSFVLAAFEIAK